MNGWSALLDDRYLGEFDIEIGGEFDIDWLAVYGLALVLRLTVLALRAWIVPLICLQFGTRPLIWLLFAVSVPAVTKGCSLQITWNLQTGKKIKSFWKPLQLARRAVGMSSYICFWRIRFRNVIKLKSSIFAHDTNSDCPEKKGNFKYKCLSRSWQWIHLKHKAQYETMKTIKYNWDK